MEDGRNKHVSEEEKKKGFLIHILIGVLVSIMIITIIIIFPKGKNDDEEKEYSSKVSESLSEERENKESSDTIKSNKNKNKVEISIKEGTLSSEGATIIITDTNKEKFTWIPAYTLQQKKNKKWQDMLLKYPENITDLPDKTIENKTGTIEQSLVWSNKYGTLESGEYRIVKESDGMKFYAEFKID